MKKVNKNSLKIKSLVKSLNDKQKAYVNLNLKNPKNGEYLLTVSHLIFKDTDSFSY